MAEGAFAIKYGDRRFPLAPASYALVLGCGIEDGARAAGDSDPAVIELKSVLTATRNLPDRCETSSDKMAERERESMVVKSRLRTTVPRQ